MPTSVFCSASARHGTPRLRNHFNQRTAQQVRLFVSSLKAAPVCITDQSHGIEHQNHALCVVQDVAIEIALATIAALRFAPVGNILEHMNRSAGIFFAGMDARSGNQIRALACGVNEFFQRHSHVATKRTSPRLRRRLQEFHLADIPAHSFRGRHSQKIRERAVEAQHPPVMVVHHDEIGDGVKIFDPLFSRALDSREQSHVLERHRCMARQSFKQLAFRRRKFSPQIHQAKHAEQLAFTLR